MHRIGAEMVAKSPPDGHTLFMGTSGPMSINISIYPEIIARLYKESAAILQDRVSREKMDASDFEPTMLGPEQFGAHIRREIEKWGKVVKATGARTE